MTDPTSFGELTTLASSTQVAPSAQLVTRWEYRRHRLTLAAQQGEPIDPADLLDELRLSEAAARALTDNRWPRVAILVLVGGASLWLGIADALDLRPDKAYGQFLAWLADQKALYRATGRGLSPAELDRLDAALKEVTW